MVDTKYSINTLTFYVSSCRIKETGSYQTFYC
nr:MAG TPA: hypothetical protein [Caudoviricetes sp.]